MISMTTNPTPRTDLKRLITRQIAIFNGLNASAMEQSHKLHAQYSTLAENILATIERKIGPING